jgi:hypothetical protein
MVGISNCRQGVILIVVNRSLKIYDQASDVNERICLAEHSFPLQEEVVPLSPESVRSSAVDNPSLVQSVIELAVESFFGPVSSML